jgi:hypothetical protein
LFSLLRPWPPFPTRNRASLALFATGEELEITIARAPASMNYKFTPGVVVAKY